MIKSTKRVVHGKRDSRMERIAGKVSDKVGSDLSHIILCNLSVIFKKKFRSPSPKREPPICLPWRKSPHPSSRTPLFSLQRLFWRLKHSFNFIFRRNFYLLPKKNFKKQYESEILKKNYLKDDKFWKEEQFSGWRDPHGTDDGRDEGQADGQQTQRETQLHGRRWQADRSPGTGKRIDLFSGKMTSFKSDLFRTTTGSISKRSWTSTISRRASEFGSEAGWETTIINAQESGYSNMEEFRI